MSGVSGGEEVVGHVLASTTDIRGVADEGAPLADVEALAMVLADLITLAKQKVKRAGPNGGIHKLEAAAGGEDTQGLREPQAPCKKNRREISTTSRSGVHVGRFRILAGFRAE